MSAEILIAIIIIWFILSFIFTIYKKKHGRNKLQAGELILTLVLSIPLVIILVLVHVVK